MRLIVTIFITLLLGLASATATFAALVPPTLPDFPNDRVWFNTRPLTRENLEGKVVLYDFWTYSCINCIRTIPYLKAWYNRYHKIGFEIIGIHAPEFAFERDHNNVRQAIEKFGVTWPVVLDNDNSLWNLFHNRFWPAKYLYGADGKLVMSHFGEGAYDETESAIRVALKKVGHNANYDAPMRVDAEEVDFRAVETPEIYFGYRRLEFSQNGNIKQHESERYAAPAQIERNHFAFDGLWKIESEKAMATAPGSRLILRYRARTVNIVAGSLQAPVRFKLKIDGKPLAHKWEAADSKTAIQFNRLYRLIDTKGAEEHLLEITFELPGVEVYTFTFG